MMMTVTTKGGDSTVAVLDSLPYVEAVHEDYEEYALALIEEEMKAIEPRPLKKVPPVKFRTFLMESEYGNVKISRDNDPDPNNHNDNEVATIERVEHVSFQPSKIARPTTIDEWKGHAIPEIKKRFEAERIRGMVLEAEKEDGVDSWKSHNSALDDLKALWTRKLKERTDAVEEINFQRQRMQQDHFGPELDKLNLEYQEALYRRNQLEHAVEGLRRT
jgi:hypothetical protein